MSDGVVFDFSDLSRFGDKVNLARQAVAKMGRSFWGLVATEMYQEEDQIFRHEGAVGGNPRWKELSQETKVRRYERLHPAGIYSARGGVRATAIHAMANAKILQDTGQLRMSIGVQTITDDSLEFGTNLPYAAIHQYGGYNEEGRKVPQRRFVFVSDERVQKITAIANTEIRRLMNESGIS